DDGLQVRLRDVHLEADLGLGAERALEEQADLLDLLALPRRVPRVAVRDELRHRLEELAADAQAVRADRRAGLGDLDDRVDEALRDLRFRRTPAELDLHVDVALREPALRVADELGCDALAVQVLGLLHRRVASDDEHPARRPEARLRVDELVRDVYLRVVLEHPVAAGDTRVEHATLDVTRHLLRADEQAAEVRI